MEARLSREWRLFWCAVGFLTRLPTPASREFEPGWIGRSARWFSLVGQIVGVLAAVVFLAAGRFWDGAAPAVLAIGAGVWITGAFHEDGLADTADGLGGGTTPQARLAIMKDSRIGTYGVLALVLSVGLRIAALAVAEALLHHAPERRVEITVIEEVVGHLLQERVGIEVESDLRTVPTRVLESRRHASTAWTTCLW